MYGLASGAAQLWLNANPMLDRWDYLLTRPAAYADSPYWSPQFIEEQEKLGWDTTFHGQWYNTEQGRRSTLGQPSGPATTVYVFGSSTVYGTEVPDQYTIPSQLQSLFNHTYHAPYRIVNMGEWSANAFRQYQLLQLIDLKRGDIVIFYDGAVDAGSAYTVAVNRRRQTFPDSLCANLPDQLQVAVMWAMCSSIENSVPAEINDAAQLRQALTQAASQYRDSIAMAATYTRHAGAVFYHFLQPTIWSMPLSPGEREMVSHPYVVQNQMDTVVTDAWPMLQHALVTLPDVTTIDLTHVLDSTRAAGVPLYLDCCHLTERGNAIVAHAIFDALTTF